MLIFLKLGGSLITDKNHAHTARLDIIHRLADEIKGSIENIPELSLLLAHGSGSFGHVPAQEYCTRNGVTTTLQWQGFLRVWREAHGLHQILLDILSEHNLPVISFPPSAMVTAKNKTIEKWNIDPIQSALSANLIPVVFGDVVFDLEKGATIFSTEELFLPLADHLHPQKILIAGIEEGVWQDFPNCQQVVKEITHDSDILKTKRIGPSRSIDVTGGMLEKVNLMQQLTSKHRQMLASIFSGLVPHNLTRCLIGEELGTTIRY
jgi:isopentenyl phosphate kinase